jgi:hypothetical protein
MFHPIVGYLHCLCCGEAAEAVHHVKRHDDAYLLTSWQPGIKREEEEGTGDPHIPVNGKLPIA